LRRTKIEGVLEQKNMWTYEEVSGGQGKCKLSGIVRSFVICTPQNYIRTMILWMLGLMWHIAGMVGNEIHFQDFCRKTRRVKTRHEDSKVCVGLIWLQIVASGGLYLTQQRLFNFLKFCEFVD
jgi:hypothetical protein